MAFIKDKLMKWCGPESTAFTRLDLFKHQSLSVQINLNFGAGRSSEELLALLVFVLVSQIQLVGIKVSVKKWQNEINLSRKYTQYTHSFFCVCEQLFAVT